MQTMTIKEARARMRYAVDLVEQGESIVITRNGRQAARLCPVQEKSRPLPSLQEFRKGLKRPSPSLSESVVKARAQERY